MYNYNNNKKKIDQSKIREVMFQAQCNSPHVTQYFGSYLRGTELWISMEYVGGGSCQDLIKVVTLNEEQIR